MVGNMASYRLFRNGAYRMWKAWGILGTTNHVLRTNQGKLYFERVIHLVFHGDPV